MVCKFHREGGFGESGDLRDFDVLGIPYVDIEVESTTIYGSQVQFFVIYYISKFGTGIG